MFALPAVFGSPRWRRFAKNLIGGSSPRAPRRTPPRRGFRPSIEGLEGRDLMTGVPAAPAVMAKPVSGTQVNLSWSPVSGASGYAVDEWVNGAWQQIGNFGSGTTSDAVKGLSPNTTYYFDVAAYNSVGTTWANYSTVTTKSPTITVNEPTAGATYTPVSGTLFGANGPVFTDLHQGIEGDCWLMSSLAEVAARDPQDIRNMFT